MMNGEWNGMMHDRSYPIYDHYKKLDMMSPGYILLLLPSSSPPPLSLTLFLTLMSMCQVGMPPPGIDVSTPTLQSKLSAALATHHCVPVFLEQNLIDLFIKVGLISQHII
jgi:hypothetical protein